MHLKFHYRNLHVYDDTNSACHLCNQFNIETDSTYVHTCMFIATQDFLNDTASQSAMYVYIICMYMVCMQAWCIYICI